MLVKITKHFCNTCEKEFEGPPKIEFENPNEEVAEKFSFSRKRSVIFVIHVMLQLQNIENSKNQTRKQKLEVQNH